MVEAACSSVPDAKAVYIDEVISFVPEEHSNSEGELNRPTYFDASRSSSLRPKPSISLKRKASDSLSDDEALHEQKPPRKGIKRSKHAPVETPKQASTMLKMPPHTPETRQAIFLLDTPIHETAEGFDAYWPLIEIS